MVDCCSCCKYNPLELIDRVGALLGNGFRYLCGLGKSSTDILIAEADRLKATRDGLETTVSNQEDIQDRGRSQQVTQWMKETDDLLDDVDNFKRSWIYRTPCVKDCPCWVTDMLGRVRKQIAEEGNLTEEKLLGVEPLSRVYSVHDPQIVGREKTLEEVCGLVRNSDINIVGIYGMPGIGKTALLQQIYHELSKSNSQGGGDKRPAAKRVTDPDQQGGAQKKKKKKGWITCPKKRKIEKKGGDDLSPRKILDEPAERVVIYAKVSKQVNILNLQREIGKQLGLPFTEDGPSDVSGQVRHQAQALKTRLRNYRGLIILLLEDVWQRLEWDDIGIPSPDVHETTCKIIFTTPFQHVCRDIAGDGAGTIKLGFLSDKESWRVFCQKLQKSEDDGSISPAKEMIRRCGGLPGAIVTISPLAGRSAIETSLLKEMEETLRHSPHKIDGMKDKVLSPLKSIFHKLEEMIHIKEERGVEMIQYLLYCSLFPEDQNIYVDQLIDYWVGEGFLDANCYATLPIARGRGRNIIRTLVNECVLESTGEDHHKEVRLHDAVRGMALWLTDGESSEQSKLFLTSSRLKACTKLRWPAAERISSMDNGEKVFPPDIECKNLLTFLFNNYGIHLHCCRHSTLRRHPIHCTGDTINLSHELCEIKGEPRDFFKFARALKVLDLSGTNMETVPAEICSIEQLQYLNLSYTRITSLPNALRKLKKLRQLKLRGTSYLSSIPTGSLPQHPILQMLDLVDSHYTWRPQSTNPVTGLLDSEIKLQHLSQDRWSFLNELGLTIADHWSLESLCSSEKLSESTVFLKLQDVQELSEAHLSSVFKTMENLRELSISGTNLVTQLKLKADQLPKLEALDLHNMPSVSTIVVSGEVSLLFTSLQHLHISSCPLLTDTWWVRLLPNLVDIVLSNCGGVEELVGGQATGQPQVCLSKKLREIHLVDLPNFKRMTGLPLSAPSLEILAVTNCRLFKVLSFEKDTATNVRKIIGERIWWDGVQWDHNHETKSILETRFTMPESPVLTAS